MSRTNCHYHVYVYRLPNNYQPVENIIYRSRSGALARRGKVEAPLTPMVVRCYQNLDRCKGE